MVLSEAVDIQVILLKNAPELSRGALEGSANLVIQGAGHHLLLVDQALFDAHEFWLLVLA
jgi:hypothetical protein